MYDSSKQRKDEKLFVLILKCLDEKDTYKKIHFAYFLTFSINEEIIDNKVLKKFQKLLKETLLDEQLIRELRKRESIIQEDGNVYFGREYLESPYNYDKELEEHILAIDFSITEFLASVMNEIDIPKGFKLDEI